MEPFYNYISIDLDALDRNYDAICRKAGTPAMAVVKSDGYGHGALPLARHLQPKAPFFAVATMGEALALRRGGIQKPILILSRVSPAAFEAAIRQEIRLTVFRYDDALALSRQAAQLGKTAKVHLAVDTGMGRIGVTADAAGAALCREIATLPGLEIEGLFSHYATADEADLSRASAQQARFEAFLSILALPIPMVHIRNSAGIMNFTDGHAMARAGIVLYGSYPSSQVDRARMEVQPILSWHSHITHLKTLAVGSQVGYGGTFTASRETKVATIPVGYADGYRRCLSGKFHVLIGGCEAPILGRICMDQMMVDVTDIPGVKSDDPVVLMGRQGDKEITAEQMAEAAGTISYEIFTGLSRRVPRVYTAGGEIREILQYFPEE